MGINGGYFPAICGYVYVLVFFDGEGKCVFTTAEIEATSLH